MHIEKIEYGHEKVGFWSNAAFLLIIVLTLVATGITGNLLLKIITVDVSTASTRAFIEEVGKMLAYLLFVIAAIIYLYIKGLLQDEHVTTLE